MVVILPAMPTRLAPGCRRDFISAFTMNYIDEAAEEFDDGNPRRMFVLNLNGGSAGVNGAPSGRTFLIYVSVSAGGGSGVRGSMAKTAGEETFTRTKLSRSSAIGASLRVVR